MYPYRFTFLCSEEEKSYLSKLSAHHRRSQSDVIRLLLRDAMKSLLNGLDERLDEEKYEQKGKSYEQPSTKS